MSSCIESYSLGKKRNNCSSLPISRADSWKTAGKRTEFNENLASRDQLRSSLLCRNWIDTKLARNRLIEGKVYVCAKLLLNMKRKFSHRDIRDEDSMNLSTSCQALTFWWIKCVDWSLSSQISFASRFHNNCPTRIPRGRFSSEAIRWIKFTLRFNLSNSLSDSQVKLVFRGITRLPQVITRGEQKKQTFRLFHQRAEKLNLQQLPLPTLCVHKKKEERKTSKKNLNVDLSRCFHLVKFFYFLHEWKPPKQQSFQSFFDFFSIFTKFFFN